MVDYKKEANEARKQVLTLVHKAKTSHIASNLSIIDIATVLYDKVDLLKDRVVWSKGWVAGTIYYFLHKKGVITDEQLATFPNEPFYSLAETTVPGVEVNGGAMGHGLPIACGLAYAKKLKEEEGKVYCIMSDGEMFEGTTWESALFAGHHQLNNLVVIVDYNKWCAMGKTNEVNNLEPFKKKWEAFEFVCIEIDGHNYEEIEDVLKLNPQKPLCIIAHTTKGKGVSFMENHLLYHYKDVNDEVYEQAMSELCQN
jgi:transketolase